MIETTIVPDKKGGCGTLPVPLIVLMASTSVGHAEIRPESMCSACVGSTASRLQRSTTASSIEKSCCNMLILLLMLVVLSRSLNFDEPRDYREHTVCGGRFRRFRLINKLYSTNQACLDNGATQAMWLCTCHVVVSR